MFNTQKKHFKKLMLCDSTNENKQVILFVYYIYARFFLTYTLHLCSSLILSLYISLFCTLLIFFTMLTNRILFSLTPKINVIFAYKLYAI
jgi:hypothetical protein